MEAYIRARGLPEYYQCDVKNLTDEQWYAQGKQEIALGIYSLIYGIVCQLLYLPCLFVFLQADIFALPVYKMIFFITCCDIVSLTINSLFTGYFFIIGAVYCNFPHFMYIWGCIEMCMWSGCCCGCFVLVFSRLVDLWSHDWHDSLFLGKRISITFVIIFCYMLYFFFFVNPIMFNSVARTWIFDPLIFVDGSMFSKYACLVTTINNTATVSITMFLYLTFIVTFIYKYSRVYNFTMAPTQKQMFIQSSLVCLNNLILALIYVSMQYVKVTYTVTFMGLITWQLSSGGGVMVFLGVNRTIRTRVLRLTGLSKALGMRASSVIPHTHTIKTAEPSIHSMAI